MVAKIRVVLSDANMIGCELLQEALQRENFEVLHCCSLVEELVMAVNEKGPEIVLINAVLANGPISGFVALRQIHISRPVVKAIMMLDKHDPELIVSAFRGGAHGVFMRANPFNLLCKCIRAVHEGQVWASSHDLQLLLEMVATAAPLRTVNSAGECLLTSREQQIVNLVAQGYTNREIGLKLGLAENTVKNYLFRVFDKLGVSSRVELVLYSMQFHGHDAA